MATTNYERVGKALDLLRSGLEPIVERKKCATKAPSYNALVQSWPEVAQLARESVASQPTQGELF